jgi:hypothetical protein
MPIKVAIVFTLLIARFSVAAIGSSSRYKIVDLQILEEEGNYFEYLQHALDVRPSKRNDLWRKMTSHMGESYLKALLQLKIIEPDQMSFVDEIYQWPILNQNEFVQKYRGQLGQKYFKQCFASKETSICTKGLVKFWAKKPQPILQGPKFAALLPKDKNSIELVWSFYAPLATSKRSEFYCSDDNFKTPILNRLRAETHRKNRISDLGLSVQKLIHKNCYQLIQKELAQILKSNDVSDWQEILALRLTNKFDEKDIVLQKWLIRLYLENPAPSDQLNYAWNLLDKLSQKYVERIKVLDFLKSLDHLSDGIFALEDQSKRNILIEHLHQNFPEYMDHYAKTCVSYLSGEKKFKKGNPTINCHKLFTIDVQKRWVSKKWHQVYAKIPKL